MNIYFEVRGELVAPARARPGQILGWWEAINGAPTENRLFVFASSLSGDAVHVVRERALSTGVGALIGALHQLERAGLIVPYAECAAAWQARLAAPDVRLAEREARPPRRRRARVLPTGRASLFSVQAPLVGAVAARRGDILAVSPESPSHTFMVVANAPGFPVRQSAPFELARVSAVVSGWIDAGALVPLERFSEPASSGSRARARG